MARRSSGEAQDLERPAGDDAADRLAKEGDVKGLCVNCAHRNYCMFPRPESGVWHCEEYAVADA